MLNRSGCKVFSWWAIITGVILLLNAGEEVTCLRGSAVVLQAKAKAAELKEAGIVEALLEASGNATTNGTTTNSAQPTKAKSFLTGIPQKDYIYDPNLPRELNGHNLTNYPFYNAVPEDIEFNCDGLHDGFYASVPHKCQLYHHCLFGTRYDFLCANYTAFDQKTFICHFVSEVDCENSPKYYKRNEELYKAATTQPPPTTSTAKTTTTTVPPQPPPPPPLPRRTQGPPRNRHRRPYRRRRPVYEYYYDEDYDDPDYYEDDVIQTPRRKMNRKHRPLGGGAVHDDDTEYESQPQQTSTDMVKPSVRPSSSNSPSTGSVYDKPRIPPKIRRPVPINERDKYDYTQKTSDVAPVPTAQTTKDTTRNPQRKPQIDDDEYYDDEYEEEQQQQPKYKKIKQTDYDTGPTGTGDNRRPLNRHRLRLQNRKRPDRYEEDEDVDDDYEQEERPRFRKGQRYDDYNVRSSRPRGNRGKGYLRDDEAVPAERPGYISGSRASMSSSSHKRPQNSEYSRNHGRKHQDRRPIYDDEEEDDEYYDDEEEDVEEEKIPRRNHKPANKYNGRKDDDYADDTRNGRRQNTKTTSNNGNTGSSKSTKSKSEDNNYSKQTNKNDKSDSMNRQATSKIPEQPKTTTTVRPNYKTSSSEVQKTTSAEKYDIEEYDDDYEDIKPSSATKPLEESVSDKGENNKQNSVLKSQNQNANDQSSKQDSVGTIPNDENTKATGTYKYTTTSPVQEQTSTYTRNTNIFRSRTSSPVTDDKINTSTTPESSYHRFSSTSSYGDDYHDRDPLVNYYKPENRSRILPQVPTNNFRKQTTTTPISFEKPEILSKDEKQFKDSSLANGDSSEKPFKDYNLDSVGISGPTRPFVSVGLFRRPIKATTTNIIETTTLASEATPALSQKSLPAIGYRRVIKPSDSDDKPRRKESSLPLGYTNVFKRPSKVTELDKPIPPTTESFYDDEPSQKSLQQQITAPGNSQFRKPNKPIEMPTTESSYTIKNNENESKSTQSITSGSLPNYRRPSIYSRPVVEDYSAEYDDSPKTSQFPPSATGTNYRRPYKTQKFQDNLSSTENSQPEFNLGSTTVPPSGPGGTFRRPIEVPVKNEGSTIINLRSHYGFFNPGRPKPVGNENLPTGPDSTAYPRLQSKNIIDKPDTNIFPRQPPRNLDITAPGPSAPENQNTRNNFRGTDYSDNQNPQPGSNLDIADEEYDVTLNDALQPSTLHPTRSLVDYPHQARLKARGYLSAVTHATGFSNEQGVSPFLLSSSSSQQYISRVQNIQPQLKRIAAVPNTETKTQNKDSQASAGDEGYEAVVLAAPQYDTGNIQRWVSQRQSRPTEWYW